MISVSRRGTKKSVHTSERSATIKTHWFSGTNSPITRWPLITVPSTCERISKGCKLWLLSMTAKTSPFLTASPTCFLPSRTMPEKRGIMCATLCSTGEIFPFTRTEDSIVRGPVTFVFNPEFFATSSEKFIEKIYLSIFHRQVKKDL
jgi:hypothetical protein